MAETVWFTADTHFNHKGVLQHRPAFQSLDAMNEAMIDRWKANVRSGDRVYHLGDVVFGARNEAATMLRRLTGRIYLIRGNHDSVAEHRDCRDRFEWVKDYEYLKIDGQKIALCHYAFRTWRASHKGSWNLHGHSHGSLEQRGKQLDVGVDVWDFAPVSFEELREVMQHHHFEPVDHHGIASTNLDTSMGG